MCTVSFFNNGTEIIITSNRDENINRPLATAPQKHPKNGSTFFYPTDPKSKGTWFVANDSGEVFVLLNGAEKKHMPSPPYAKSRGLVLLELVTEGNFQDNWAEKDLSNIEPFTLIAFEKQDFKRFTWDGKEKKSYPLNNANSYIWSSSTLYDETVAQQRKDWFFDFIAKSETHIKPDSLIHFHANTHAENKENGLVINRNQFMLTKNITQCVLGSKSLKMTHIDMITHETHTIIHEKA